VGQIDELGKTVLGRFNRISLSLGSGGKTESGIVEARDEEREFCELSS
jgi:hypothetical protein